MNLSPPPADIGSSRTPGSTSFEDLDKNQPLSPSSEIPSFFKVRKSVSRKRLSMKRVKSNYVTKENNSTINTTINKAQEDKERAAREQHKRAVLEIQKKKREQQQRNIIESIRYVPKKYSIEEMKHFEQNPTKITNYLFLGTHSITKNKELLKSRGITHIFNCSKFENYHPAYFYYLNPPNLDTEEGPEIETDNRLSKILPSFLEFVSQAGKLQGRILVVSEEEDATGPALVLGFLMDNLKLSFFKAFQLVQSKRYVIQLNAPYIQQLLINDKKKQKEDYRERFTCVCRQNEWILLLPFDSTTEMNPFPCNCTIGQFSTCPNHGCGQFCNEMIDKCESNGSAAHSIGLNIKWGRTTKDNLQASFGACEEHTPYIGAGVVVQKKPWTVYKCRHCKFICYAENKKDPSIIAIVTNIRGKRT
uniref:Tyrosine-protein phosphatase domain-containing protein n=1 Tax=Arcella intermedia TaxID=1963864 RepID=A0A6B2L470_9EUKA